jgi:hypothetical protein
MIDSISETRRGRLALASPYVVKDSDDDLVPSGSATMALLVNADLVQRGIDRARFTVARVAFVPSTTTPASSSRTAGSDV